MAHSLKQILVTGGAGYIVHNLGTGQGYSVIEMIKTFEKTSGTEIPYKIIARRLGDIAACYADPGLAKAELGWEAEKGLQEMCDDTWRWQKANPKGFE